VSHLWYSIIETNSRIWKLVCLREWRVKEADIEMCALSWKRACFSPFISFKTIAEKIHNHLLQTVPYAVYLEKHQAPALPIDLFSPQFISNMRYLELSRNCLEIIPERFFDLINLSTLYLDRNRIVTISPSISKLTNLRSINLNSNKLTTLPVEFARLTQLTALRLSDNPLKSIPDELASLTNLTVCEVPIVFPEPPKKPITISFLSNALRKR